MFRQIWAKCDLAKDNFKSARDVFQIIHEHITTKRSENVWVISAFQLFAFFLTFWFYSEFFQVEVSYNILG